MYILSVKQPYAVFILLGLKRYETRSWKTNHTGKLLIHAAKTPCKNAYALCYETRIRRVLARHFTSPSDLPLGAIIGCVDLVRCIPTALWPDTGTGPGPASSYSAEKKLGDFSLGRFAWELANPVYWTDPTGHIYCPGRLGLWTLETIQEERRFATRHNVA